MKMSVLVKTEIMKLKRYNIIWIGISAVLLIVLLSRYLEIAADEEVITFVDFSNSVIWKNFSLLFPTTITLMAGYIISRERSDDTLKSILTIPISFRKLLIGKLITIGLVAILLGIICFGLTFIMFALTHDQEYTIISVLQSLWQMIVINICIYIAVMPVIIITSHSTNGFMAGVGFAFFYGFAGIFASGHGLTNIYPITAGLGIINYQDETVSSYNLPLSLLTLFTMLLISIVLVAVIGNGINRKGKKQDKSKI
jgi:ABC-2 type transport system permease protein